MTENERAAIIAANEYRKQIRAMTTPGPWVWTDSTDSGGGLTDPDWSSEFLVSKKGKHYVLGAATAELETAVISFWSEDAEGTKIRNIDARFIAYTRNDTPEDDIDQLLNAWINCYDGTPKPYEPVLVYTASGFVSTAFYGDDSWYGDGGAEVAVAYWQPMPLPPKPIKE